MTKPKMILFDYGQTLANEAGFDGVKGTAEVLKYAVRNRYRLSAAQVQAEAENLNRELGRFDPARRHLVQIEVPNHMFTAYLYESLGIELSLTPEQIDKVFWDAAAPARPTEGIQEFLEYLYEKHIRTGVISNISFSGAVVRNRIDEIVPGNHFEFIIASSEYMYRKPNRRIFDLALEKADLKPEEVWYVGDQYECDIAGAKSAGIFPVWYLGAIDLPYEKKEGIMEVRNWIELQKFLQDISCVRRQL